jgi:hypothetical protein
MSADGLAGRPDGFAVSQFATAFPHGPALGTMTRRTWSQFAVLF